MEIDKCIFDNNLIIQHKFSRLFQWKNVVIKGLDYSLTEE